MTIEEMLAAAYGQPGGGTLPPMSPGTAPAAFMAANPFTAGMTMPSVPPDAPPPPSLPTPLTPTVYGPGMGTSLGSGAGSAPSDPGAAPGATNAPAYATAQRPALPAPIADDPLFARYAEVYGQGRPDPQIEQVRREMPRFADRLQYLQSLRAQRGY